METRLLAELLVLRRLQDRRPLPPALTTSSSNKPDFIPPYLLLFTVFLTRGFSSLLFPPPETLLPQDQFQMPFSHEHLTLSMGCVHTPSKGQCPFCMADVDIYTVLSCKFLTISPSPLYVSRVRVSNCRFQPRRRIKKKKNR